MPTEPLDFDVSETIKFRVGPGWATGLILSKSAPDAYADGAVRYTIKGPKGGECVRTARSMKRRQVQVPA